MEIISALCYHIWKARNYLIFQNKNIPAMDIIQQAQHSIVEYQQHLKNDTKPNQRPSQSSRHNDCNWIPPPRAALKLNVDAHRLAGDGHWGIGLVLRREDDSCVGAATRDGWGLTEAIEAEALDLSATIEFLKGFQHNDVIIELDNQFVVKAVNHRVFPRKYWGQIARCGEEFLSENPRCSIRWVKRTGNKVAHYFARRAEIEPNSTWMGFAPPCISNHIQKDVTAL
jgi:ribonuclease HI